MGYRMDIVKFKSKIFHVTPLWQNARFSGGPSLKITVESEIILTKNLNLTKIVKV